MRIHFKLLAGLIAVMTACHQPAAEDSSAIKAKVAVDITRLSSGIIKDELTLFATTLYLKRNIVTAPIPAFIVQVFIKLGDPVKQGQLLYVLETKERRALGSGAVMPDSAATSFGKIMVKAPASGIISTLDKQQIGDYVLEGGQLCTVAESNALSFAVNVPYEYSPFAKAGAPCTLWLPDNSRHPAKFNTPLTTMNTLAQTQTVLAKSDGSLFLPENLIVRVLVNKNRETKEQILPKMAVLSDEISE